MLRKLLEEAKPRVSMPAKAVFAVILLAIGFCPLSAQSRMRKSASVDIESTSLGLYPVWGSRGLYGVGVNWSDEPLLWHIDKNGWKETIRFSFSGGHNITIVGLAEARDGGIVVVGSAYSDDGRGATFLSCIAPDRNAKTITRLWPFVPKALTVTPDGVIWMVGWVRDGDRIQQYNVLKRFDSSGVLLSSTNLRVHGPSWFPVDATASSILMASKDHVGWLTAGNEYLEYSFDGRETFRVSGPPGRFDHDESWANFVMSADGSVVVGIPAQASPDSLLKLWTLDQSKTSWSSVGGEQLSRRVHLVGFEGETVVASGDVKSSSGDSRATLDRYDISLP